MIQSTQEFARQLELCIAAGGLSYIRPSAKAVVGRQVPATTEFRSSFIYHPLNYAWNVHQNYLEKYALGPKRVLFLGMNPGPWGMAQTGIPFGEIKAVRDYLQLGGKVESPRICHPKKPVTGLDCKRSEVSGKRLWGLFAAKFPNASDFFEDHYVHNYCPLLFLNDEGQNLTPDKLSKQLLTPIQTICDEFLGKLCDLLSIQTVVGVGAFAESRALSVLAAKRINILKIPHPSPANPAANKNWKETVWKLLCAYKVW